MRESDCDWCMAMGDGVICAEWTCFHMNAMRNHIMKKYMRDRVRVTVSGDWVLNFVLHKYVKHEFSPSKNFGHISNEQTQCSSAIPACESSACCS